MTDRPPPEDALRRAASSSDRTAVQPDFRAIVDSLQHAVILTDGDLAVPGPTILYVNPAFTRLTGYAPEEVMGRSPRVLQASTTDRITLRTISSALRRGEGGQWKLINQRRDGTPYWVELRITPLLGPDGRVEQFVAFQRPTQPDIEWVDTAGAEASRDMLTGLPNRRALVAEVQRHLARDAAGQLCFAYLGIDGFRQINEAVDRPVGDAVLLAFADVLSGGVRRSDGLGRLGGEEFGICMPGIRLVEARGLAERLCRNVQAQPFATPAGPMPVTCSIGLSMALPGESLGDLLERADAALAAARRQGGNGVVVG
ncbi:sensor domain-containing diguanylate cyclase [Roseococcus sp.]|uniref:sensor domain-containing diguanylate cyclase n=1 Tax=Roseococcus sp. TaxID=2109646 RepID=UPI003BAD47C2